MTSELKTTAPSRTKGRPRNFDREEALSRALDVFWQRGYELASVAELCAAMEINPPSLYAAFGNKAKLFLEAVDFYELRYWDSTWAALEVGTDIHADIATFFDSAARILLSPNAPCGCLVALAAVNVSADSTEVRQAIDALRLEGKMLFAQRLKRAMKEGQLPETTDIKSLAAALNTMLEGMSIQARDGLTVPQLRRLGAHVVRLLPESPKTAGKHASSVAGAVS